jgi:hypothetical protein
MGVWQTVKGIFGDIFDWIKGAIGWLGEEENREDVKEIIEFFLMIFSSIGLLNEPVPKRSRPYVARCMIDMLREMKEEDVYQIAVLKRKGVIDDLTNGEIDLYSGMTLGGYVDKLKDRKPGKAK